MIDECELDGMVFNTDEDAQFVNHMFYPEQLTFKEEENALVVALDKQPSLFETAYHNKEDVVKEVRNNFQQYLPTDFNFEKYLGHF